MSGQTPPTCTMKATEARAKWSRLVNQVFRRELRILVEKDGIPVAAIVSTDDLKRLEEIDAAKVGRFKALDRFGEAFKDESPEDIEQEVAKAVAAARAQLREEGSQRTRTS